MVSDHGTFGWDSTLKIKDVYAHTHTHITYIHSLTHSFPFPVIQIRSSNSKEKKEKEERKRKNTKLRTGDLHRHKDTYQLACCVSCCCLVWCLGGCKGEKNLPVLLYINPACLQLPGSQRPLPATHSDHSVSPGKLQPPYKQGANSKREKEREENPQITANGTGKPIHRFPGGKGLNTVLCLQREMEPLPVSTER